ncbi:MAG: hypothetical protein JO149_06150 [Gammaproteobacteria bacterium]|nr:hypothetical protein [Gammaproteobacteria bacterium]
MKINLSTFLMLFLSLTLTACGFHLQGKKVLAPPLHRLYLQTADPYGYLARNLEDYLKMSEVTLVKSPEEADTVLVILQDTISQDLLAPSGTLQTRQYNLKVTVVFAINDNQGRSLLAPQTLTEERPITIQSNQILGSSNDVNLYYQQMRHTLAYAIISRIASTEVSAILVHAAEAKAPHKI